MLTIEIINTRKGTNENAKYIYKVIVNNKVIARGEVGGHNRNDGWRALLKLIAENQPVQDEIRPLEYEVYKDFEQGQPFKDER